VWPLEWPERIESKEWSSRHQPPGGTIDPGQLSCCPELGRRGVTWQCVLVVCELGMLAPGSGCYAQVGWPFAWVSLLCHHSCGKGRLDHCCWD
jgi:hypothetical protein